MTKERRWKYARHKAGHRHAGFAKSSCLPADRGQPCPCRALPKVHSDKPAERGKALRPSCMFCSRKNVAQGVICAHEAILCGTCYLLFHKLARFDDFPGWKAK